MSYTPASELVDLSTDEFTHMDDEQLAVTYKRLTQAHTGDASPTVGDHIARLERAANSVVSDRELWGEVYANE